MISALAVFIVNPPLDFQKQNEVVWQNILNSQSQGSWPRKHLISRNLNEQIPLLRPSHGKTIYDAPTSNITEYTSEQHSVDHYLVSPAGSVTEVLVCTFILYVVVCLIGLYLKFRIDKSNHRL